MTAGWRRPSRHAEVRRLELPCGLSVRLEPGPDGWVASLAGQGDPMPTGEAELGAARRKALRLAAQQLRKAIDQVTAALVDESLPPPKR